MSAQPASAAIARGIAARRGMPGLVFPAGPCAYCVAATQMVDGVFYDVTTGTRHTCPTAVAQELGKGYAAGEFACWQHGEGWDYAWRRTTVEAPGA